MAEPHVEGPHSPGPRSSAARPRRSSASSTTCKRSTGKAKATLARLPRGVELVEPTREITSADKEVTFTLRATADCLVGNYQGIVLDVTVIEDGQSVRQLSGYGMLRIDAERGSAGSPK